jgi:hypothetical protein
MTGVLEGECFISIFYKLPSSNLSLWAYFRLICQMYQCIVILRMYKRCSDIIKDSSCSQRSIQAIHFSHQLEKRVKYTTIPYFLSYKTRIKPMILGTCYSAHVKGGLKTKNNSNILLKAEMPRTLMQGQR